MTRQQKIYIFGSVAFIAGSYLIYRSIKRNVVYNAIIQDIDENAVTVNNKKATAVLTGQFHKDLNSAKSFAMLTETSVRNVAEAIKNASSVFGTNADKLISEFQKQRDKVAISQIASYYAAKYGAIKVDQSELQKIITIINSKPDVRWLT